VVRRPHVSTLAHSLSVFLHVHDVPFIEVLKAREVIEPALAAEAAMKATRADLAELEASISRMKLLREDEPLAFFEENRVFHSTIARASGNRVLEAFWLTIGILASGEHHGVSLSVKNRAHVIEAHEHILDTFKRRASDEAAAAMRAHVDELELLVRKRFRELLERPASIVARPGQTI
jgi:GntR family transcriptional regulator, transcriptional repressor for pyruvate dehydrogenase complex